MPANVTYEYQLAEKKYKEARTPAEKLRALQEMLRTCPSHKGAENIRQEIKQRISKIKQQLQKEKISKKGAGYKTSIKKEGAAQVVLIGLPNSGKSWTLTKITNAKPKIAEYEFTTKEPEIGTMDYHGVKIQIIEIPAFFEGFSESGKGPTYMGIIRSADLILIILDGKNKCENDLKLIEDELRKSDIVLEYDTGKFGIENKKALLYVNKNFKYFNTRLKVTKLENLKQEIWNKLNLIYAQTKTPGKKPDIPPVALKKGSTIKNLAQEVHKDFIVKFKYARVWGKSAKYQGANAGLEHVLKEGDIVEFHTQ